VGSLAPGKFADVIVLSGNPLTTPEAGLKDLTVLATMVGGRYEYCRTPNSDLCPGYQARRPTPLPDLRPPVPVRWLMLGLAAVLPLGAALAAWRRPGQRWLLRLAGAAGVIGGLLWAWLWAWADQNVTGDAYAWLTWSRLAATTLLAVASITIAGAQPHTRLGTLGVAMAALGMVSVAAGVLLGDWFQTDYGWLLLVFGVLGHALGLVVLGLANWLARRRGARHWLPLAVGVLGGVLPLLLSSVAGETLWPTLIMGAGLGVGWALLGLLNLTSPRAA
jgi:hypothetical protein